MSISKTWIDLQPPETSIHHALKTDTIVVNDIMGMLEVAREQSDLPYSRIPFFFSRINNILNHLIVIREIKGLEQSYYFRRKVMEKLQISDRDSHIAVLLFFMKNQNYKDRFDKSLQSIIQSMQSGTSYQDAIHDCWVSSDKRYFDYDLTNFHDYKQLMKSYSIQKYGEMPSKK